MNKLKVEEKRPVILYFNKPTKYAQKEKNDERKYET